MNKIMILLTVCLLGAFAQADIQAKKVETDLAKTPDINADFWGQAPESTLELTAQMMVAPKPKVAQTEKIRVQAVNNGKWLAIRMKWKADKKSEAGKLGEFSDAVAIEFPVKSNEVPPPFFMGGKDDPVHLFHWRAQYQYDEEHGKKTIKDIYPNMSIDNYPLEFKGVENVKTSDEAREAFSTGLAAGNPQSYVKHSVDEIMAEGFGSSAVIEKTESFAKGEFKNGEWTVVITRALSREGGSVIPAKGKTQACFAVWQGGKDEVGSRKSITVTWTPIILE